jgi:hypothetical protein
VRLNRHEPRILIQEGNRTLKIVQLTKGFIATVSDVDYARVMKAGPWHTSISSCKQNGRPLVYAKRDIVRANGTRTTQYLHRFVKGVKDKKAEVDHVDHNGLHCQRSNLRVATSSQNKANARLRSDNTSGLKGVYQRKDTSKWAAQIVAHKRHYCLGHFTTKEEAKTVYDEASRQLHGKFACAA